MVGYGSHESELGVQVATALLPRSWEIKLKEGFFIVRITKQEAEYLTQNGVKYGEGGLTSTTGHHKSWYMTESEKCVRLLKEYREKYYK